MGSGFSRWFDSMSLSNDTHYLTKKCRISYWWSTGERQVQNQHHCFKTQPEKIMVGSIDPLPWVCIIYSLLIVFLCTWVKVENNQKYEDMNYKSDFCSFVNVFACFILPPHTDSSTAMVNCDPPPLTTHIYM